MSKVRADAVTRYQVILIDGRPAEVWTTRSYHTVGYSAEESRLIEIARLEILAVDGRRLNVAPDEFVDACE